MKEEFSFNDDMIITRTFESWSKTDDKVKISFNNDIYLNKSQSILWELFDGHNKISDILLAVKSYDKKEVISFIKKCVEYQLVEIYEENIWI